MWRTKHRAAQDWINPTQIASFTLYIHRLPHIRSLCPDVRHSDKAHAAPCMQLPWILFGKVLKINSRLGTLNQRVIQMSQWCPSAASAMFSFLFSLLDSFKSQESYMLCAHVKAHSIVCKSIYTFFSPRQTYSVFWKQLEERTKIRKRLRSIEMLLNKLRIFMTTGCGGLRVTFAIKTATSAELWLVPASTQKTSRPRWRLLNK